MRADIHVLTDGSRKEWLNALLRSLEDQPCNINIVQCLNEHLGAARARAFLVGDSEFVGYADDDDLVEKESIQALIDALQEDPKAVGAYTDEVQMTAGGYIFADGFSTGQSYSLRGHLGAIKHIHHIWLGRREVVERYLSQAILANRAFHWALTCLMRIDGPWIHVPMVGYRWRQHPGGAHHRTDPSAIKTMARIIVARWIEAGITTPENMPQSLVES